MAGRAREMEHGGIAERAAGGRAVRGDLPRSAHADWNPAADRVDPVALLEEQAATRLADFVPIRYGRMLASPFAFYRGAAYVMAADLGSGARTDIRTQLCGDAHLSNFGAFAAPDRRLVFSINDFDETLPGPFEWDVKRLVASFAVAGRERGFDVEHASAINLAGRRAPTVSRCGSLPSCLTSTSGTRTGRRRRGGAGNRVRSWAPTSTSSSRPASRRRGPETA